ncbi:tape measure protein [Rhodococcoides fascians]|uniref:tape measure protein n=1 Tax=Rhodococcoides fascians TaxID=1828 RepID=UPI00052300A4|nr:tape measure protein [Rhodococcus fascians]
MTELGVGYLSIVASTNGMQRQITQAMNGAAGQADRIGESMGGKLASGMAKTLKVGALATGAAVGGLLATSITKGLDRLSAIDNAQGKLTSLGNSTASTAKIMDSALASVKGTAYGLGDAATIAASAVAAGVKPGEDLTKYLKLTADAASIAGVNLSEMGQIINKVQTSGTAYTMEITQLADRGLPIWQWLAKEMGVAQSEMKDLVAEGKVDSATYLAAIENNIGGAATAATTVSSAWANLGAAQGRFGATVAGPIFRQAIPAFSALTKSVDDLDARVKPVMDRFERNMTRSYIPAVLDFGRTAREEFGQFRDSELVTSSVAGLSRTFDVLLDTTRDIAPSVEGIGRSLGIAAAATGVSTWQIFLSVLESSARILDATLVPALEVTADLMTENQGVVNALALGFLAFKTVPGLLAPAAASLARLQASSVASAAGVRQVTSASGGLVNLANYGTTTLGRFGSQIQVLGQRSPAIAGMQGAFLNAAAGADRFGRMAGTAAAMSQGMTRGASALSNLVGGPLVVGLAAAAAGVYTLVQNYQRADKQQDIIAASAKGVASAQRDMAKAFSASAGDVDDTVLAAAARGVDSYTQSIEQLADSGPGMIEKITLGGSAIGAGLSGNFRGVKDSIAAMSDETADAAKIAKDQFEALGYSSEQLVEKFNGSQQAWDSFLASLREQGMHELVAELSQQKDEFDKLRDSMKRIGPASLEITEGLKQISDAAGDGKTKLSGLQQILQGLGILETDGQAALFQTAEAVREITEAAKQAADPVGGLGEELVGLDGNLDPKMGNAKELRENLMTIGSEFQSLRTNGIDTRGAMEQLWPAIQGTADRFGFTTERVEELARQFGLLPAETDVALSVEGGDAAYAAVANVKLLMDQIEGDGPKTVTLKVEDESARNALKQLGYEVEVIDASTGEVKVTANNDLAVIALEQVRAAVAGLNISIADPKITADSTRFRLEDQAVRDRLGELDRSSASPEVSALIDKFLAGRDVTLAELQKIDLSTAEPDVKLLVEQALAQAKVVNDAIDQAARDRRTQIEFDLVEYGARVTSFRNSQPGGNVAGPVSILPGNATGSRLPTSGPGTDRTDGILGVSRLTGAPTTWVDAGEWIINGRSSEIYDKELAAINAGTFPRHEEGGRLGVVSASDLLSFVNGSQSIPLTGAPYRWGKTEWGDCSGAMSAIARFAVGLAPFADRFATASQGSALSAMGFSMGRGGPNDLRFGWVNGGPGGGHTAGTLPGEINVEMGGGYGGGMVGGTVGSNAAQFTDHAYLTIPGTSSFTNPGGYPSGGRGRLSRSAPVWSDKQQLQLEDAAIAVTRAEEARAKVEQQFAEGKKSQADVDAANSKVRLAEQKVVDLQAKKDEVANYVADGPAPQAPALSRAFSDAETERIDAQLALESANTRRNEVYDDPDASQAERDKADADLYAAEQKLKLAGTTSKSDSSSSTPSSWSELAGQFAKDFISGQVSDALSVFGVPDELPGAVKAAQMLAEALSGDPGGQQMTGPAGVVDPGSATQQEILQDSPIAYDPSKGPEQWVPVIDEALARTGRALSETAGTVERIAQRSGGDPANLLGLSLREFADKRDPSLPNDPAVPLSNLVAGLRATKGVRAYHDGGEVTGPAGRDQVPALLERKEFVVKQRYAQAGSNPAILNAMNSGTNFAVSQSEPTSVVKQGSTFNIYAADLDDGIRKWKVAEMVAAHSGIGTLS